jgi:hypothetical protein
MVSASAIPAHWRRVELGNGWLSLVPPEPNQGGVGQVLVAAHRITDAPNLEAEVQKWTKSDPLVSRRTIHPTKAVRGGCGDIEEFAVRQQVVGFTILATSYVCRIGGEMYAVHLSAGEGDKNQPLYRKGALEMMWSLRVGS